MPSGCDSRIRTWAVIAEDGRHSWLGRETNPTPEEVDAVEKGLTTAGLGGGWLAVVEGTYFGVRQLELLMVRELGKPVTGWIDARDSFLRLREQALT